jgi:hypothetical protein
LLAASLTTVLFTSEGEILVSCLQYLSDRNNGDDCLCNTHMIP